MGGSSSKSKSAKVAADVPTGAADDTGPTNSRKRNLLDKGSGRLDSKPATSRTDAKSRDQQDSVPRDGLSSAPTNGSDGPGTPMKRTHSAPRIGLPEDAKATAQQGAAAGKRWVSTPTASAGSVCVV